MEGVFRWRRCVGGGGVLVLVEGAFWWSEPFNGWRGRFGGRSILEGAFWWKEHFGGGGCLVEGAFWWKEHFGGEGDLVQGVIWWRGRFGGWFGGGAFWMWKGRLVEGAFW